MITPVSQGSKWISIGVLKVFCELPVPVFVQELQELVHSVSGSEYTKLLDEI